MLHEDKELFHFFWGQSQFSYNIGSEESFKDLMKEARDTLSSKMIKANLPSPQIQGFK